VAVYSSLRWDAGADFDRLQRVLELAKRPLELQVENSAELRIFEHAPAFRWELRGSRGRLERHLTPGRLGFAPIRTG
jgi:hypothetical protein